MNDRQGRKQRDLIHERRSLGACVDHSRRRAFVLGEASSYVQRHQTVSLANSAGDGSDREKAALAVGP